MQNDLLSSFERYLRVERQLSAHTWRAYRRDLADLERYLQAEGAASLDTLVGVQALTHRRLRQWVGYLLQQGLKPRSVSRKVSALRSYLSYLRRQELIDHNPAQRLQLPKVKRSLPNFLKERETEALFEDLVFPDGFEGERDRCLLELLYGCGLRRSELIALGPQDMSFDPPSLRVQGKGARERMVPFGPTLAQALRRYLEAAHDAGLTLDRHLLVRPGGESLYPKLVYRIVNRYLGEVSSLDRRSPHVLRHTYATHLLDRGADLNAIKELLGHQSLAATQVYTHNSISKLKAVHQQAHPRAENHTD